MKSPKTLTAVLLLAPFILCFAIALDIYSPCIPDIKTYFSTSTLAVQLTVSLFILMTGLGQLIAGPLSDQFGRRIIVVSATALYFISSLASTFAPNMTILVLSRMLQGLGACGMMVACFAIVRDLFSGDDSAKIYSFLNSTIAISPLLAPSIGGYLGVYLNWRAAFGFLAITAFGMLIVAIFGIKETLPSNHRVPVSKDLFTNYRRILTSRAFCMYAFSSAVGFACFLTFFSVSPYIIIKLLGVAEEHFGIYFAMIGLVFFLGSLLSGYLAKKIHTYRTVVLGAMLITLAGIVMLLWYLLFGLSLSAFMYPMMVMGIGGALVMGAGAGGAIEPFPEMAGAASALFGSCQFVFAFAISTIILKWEVINTIPLAFTMLILGGLAFCFALSCRKISTKSQAV